METFKVPEVLVKVIFYFLYFIFYAFLSSVILGCILKANENYRMLKIPVMCSFKNTLALHPPWNMPIIRPCLAWVSKYFRNGHSSNLISFDLRILSSSNSEKFFIIRDGRGKYEKKDNTSFFVFSIKAKKKSFSSEVKHFRAFLNDNEKLHISYYLLTCFWKRLDIIW